MKFTWKATLPFLLLFLSFDLIAQDPPPPWIGDDPPCCKGEIYGMEEGEGGGRGSLLQIPDDAPKLTYSVYLVPDGANPQSLRDCELLWWSEEFGSFDAYGTARCDGIVYQAYKHEVNWDANVLCGYGSRIDVMHVVTHNTGTMANPEMVHYPIEDFPLIAPACAMPLAVAAPNFINNTSKVFENYRPRCRPKGGPIYSVFPNPFSRRLIIEDKGNIDQLVITDITGQVIYNQRGEIPSQIYTAQWKNGIYFVQLIHKDQSTSIQKLLKTE